MVKNYMEDVVEHLMPSVLERYGDICKCQRCIEDIKALTLNNLKPLYVASDKGTTYAKVNELIVQFNTDVVRQLMYAIDIVSKNPRH
jgi:Late competence development protein ComFB.